MTQRSRADLKGFFKSLAVPTEQQYADLIDSTCNGIDDQVAVVDGAMTVGGAGDLRATLVIVGPSVSAAGTVTLVAGSTSVLGMGTSFVSTVSPDDLIRVDTDTYRVQSVEDDTHLTLAAPAVQAGFSQRYCAGPLLQVAGGPEGPAVTVSAGGSVGLGTAHPASTLDVRGTITAEHFAGPLEAASIAGKLGVGQLPEIPASQVTGIFAPDQIPGFQALLDRITALEQLVTGLSPSLPLVQPVTGHVADGFAPSNPLVHSDPAVAMFVTLDGTALVVKCPPDPGVLSVCYGDKGDFTISGLSAGMHQIQASATGYESVAITVSAGLNAVAPVILLPRLNTLSGVVSSTALGTLVFGGSVTLYDTAGQTLVAHATVDPFTGHYYIANLAHGSYVVVASASGTPVPKSTQTVTIALNTDQVLNISLDAVTPTPTAPTTPMPTTPMPTTPMPTGPTPTVPIPTGPTAGIKFDGATTWVRLSQNSVQQIAYRDRTGGYPASPNSLVDLANTGFTVEATVAPSGSALLPVITCLADPAPAPGSSQFTHDGALFGLHVKDLVPGFWAYCAQWDSGQAHDPVVMSLTGPSAVPDSQWSHIAICWSYGTGLTLFVEGKPVATALWNTFVPTFYRFVIGTDGARQNFFRGHVKEIFLWKGPRYGDPPTTLPTAPILTSDRASLAAAQQKGLGGYFPCDEAAGTTMRDHTAVANDGAIINPNW